MSTRLNITFPRILLHCGHRAEGKPACTDSDSSLRKKVKGVRVLWCGPLIRLPKLRRGVTREPREPGEPGEPGASTSQSSNMTFIRPIKIINVDAAQITQYQQIVEESDF